jgi:hypothetical protein
MSGEKEGYDSTTPNTVSAIVCDLNHTSPHLLWYLGVALILWDY